ncbi:DNA transposase THAP9 [Huso huso]|uniref:DNA transposase THAP9 n=1 Tax=Huso huso TaxID=61971 RepID=A0ABR0YST4_HUSHU
MLEITFSYLAPADLRSLLESKAQQKDPRDSYPPELQAFALTLQFYSDAKAYSYVVNTFDLPFPPLAVIRSWYAGAGGEPGFSQEVFSALRFQVNEARSRQKEVICALLINEMSLCKEIEWDGMKYRGFVDIGTGIDNESTPVATKALVFMVVSLTSSWKVPCGYFLIRGLSGEERANLVADCLRKLHDVGVTVVSLSCDGPSCHFDMAAKLGAELELPDPATWFPHPSDVSKKVFLIPDLCHMSRLLGVALAMEGTLLNGDGKLIKWTYIEELHKLQEKEGLSAGCKLPATPNPQGWNQKLHRNLVSEMISARIADSLEFCCVVLKLPQFQGCEATVQFIRRFDALFDLLNSRNPLAKNFKAPMRLANEALWRPFLYKAQNYIFQLKSQAGTPMHQSRLSMPFIGFLAVTKAALALYDSLVAPKTPPLKNLLMYKFSQDNLELFFSAVRIQSFWNNYNPSAGEFVAAYKRLLQLHDTRRPAENCREHDAAAILYVIRDSYVIHEGSVDTLDMSRSRRFNLEEMPPVHSEQDIAEIPDIVSFSSYAGRAIAFLADHVVKMVLKRTKCRDCLSALTTDAPDNSSQKCLPPKDWIGVSDGVIIVCQAAETHFKRFLYTTRGSDLPQAPIIVSTIGSVVLCDVGEKTIFPTLLEHMFDSTPDSNHVFRLIKTVAECYIRIRMYHRCKFLYLLGIAGVGPQKNLKISII